MAQTVAPPLTVYEDKLIDQGQLPPDDGQLGGSRAYVTEGQPRLLRIETQLGQTRINDVSSNVQGLQLYGQLETEQYGALSLDFALRRGLGSSQILTLRQSAMPFDKGWKLNNTLGVFTPSSTDLSRNQSRFVLPSSLIEGIGTEWTNERLGVGLSASIGEPSVFEGSQLPRLLGLGGRLAQVSAQFKQDQWQLAFTGTHRSFDASTASTNVSNADTSSRAQNGGFIGLRYALSADTALQFNGLTSSGADGATHHGLWLDATTRSGAHRHGFGLFQFDKDLSWIGQPTTSGISGAYYRYNFGNRQWAIDANLESLSAKDSTSSSGFYGSLNGRYQYARDLSVGGGLAPLW
jgi:hypothetical protein